jgi:hypothetical protein
MRYKTKVIQKAKILPGLQKIRKTAQSTGVLMENKP